MAKSNIGIFGLGEVGSAIAGIFSAKFSVLKKDLDIDELKENKIEVLHVCLPYNNSFEEAVIAQAKANQPNLIIIHSTVKPGTTANLFTIIKTPIVHSPVMGTHPNLEKDIHDFTKFIGPVDNKSRDLATEHFRQVGIKVKALQSPLESELGKLLDTTYYAWNIIFEKLVWQICSTAGADFESVYTQFNEVYNQSYKKSKPSVLRPVLKHQQGPIGGHCIIPNAELLEKTMPSTISKVIIEENKQFSR